MQPDKRARRLIGEAAFIDAAEAGLPRQGERVVSKCPMRERLEGCGRSPTGADDSAEHGKNENQRRLLHSARFEVPFESPSARELRA